MSFQTERPKSTAEMIAELRKLKLERKTNRKALLENFNEKKISDERQSVLEGTQAEVEEEALKNEHLESIRDRRRKERAVKESSLNRLTLLESAKKITMNKVLFEMVYDAYWLDDDVKRTSIQETYNEYKNVLALVESVCGDSKTKDDDKTEFIKNVETVVEEACKKAVNRIVKEQKESEEPDKEFEFTSEEESDLDKKLSELGRDELVELIKKKVLTVVQDERKSGKEKAEMLKELDDDEEDNDDDDNEETEDEEDSDKDDENDDDDEDDDESVEEGYLPCEPVEEGVREFFKSLKYNVAHNKQVNDVSKYLNLFGKDCAGVFREGYALQTKREYDDAIKQYQKYISIIQNKQKDADKYIKEKGYNSAVSQTIKTGLTQEINLTKSYIAQCKNKKKFVTEDYKATLEVMVAQKQKRSLRNSMGGTLFESFMIANTSSIRDEAVTEGVDIDTTSAMNAALIESILQYTVLETLNTAKLYKFTSSDVNKLKAANRSSLRQ